MSKQKIYLISCTKKKEARRCKARDMYMPSPRFRHSVSIAERARARFFIVSAKHHLLKPDDVISPYEKTLNNMGIKQRQEWAEEVIKQMEVSLPRSGTAVILMGMSYCEYLLEWLNKRFKNVEQPLEGFRSGEQLQKLKSMAQS